MGLVLCHFCALLCCLRPLLPPSLLCLWALRHHSEWGLEVNRKNIQQNIQDIEGKSAEGLTV